MRRGELFVCVVMWWVCASAHADGAGGDAVREVTTAQGAVRGHKDPHTGVFAFYGIPYATAPTGSKKFMPPLPGPTWQLPLDAVDKGIVCPQMANPYVASKLMQEDCLVASVYVPDTDEKKLPVAVYVHGGAFQIGFGNMIPPFSFVKNKKVVAVTFNYRLGVSGFLCLGTEEAPGNAGMKDQVALLRWVQKNIANFGGNPKDVTLIGGSAGSISVDLLMLSKATNGLFKRVIPESGVALSASAVQVDPIEYAMNFASNFGFTDVDDIYALQTFFQDTPLDTFYKNANIFNPNSTFGFTPCVERYPGNDIFLDDAPFTILRIGNYRKMPMLLGFDNMEGLLQVAKFDEWKEKMNEKFSDFLPVDLQFQNTTEKEKVAKKVKKFYFGNKPIDESGILGYIDFFTDIVFAYPTLSSVQLHVQNGHKQIYLYVYSFVDEDTPLVPHTDVRGATHCAQTIHVMNGRKYLNPNDRNVSEEYLEMQNTLQDMWYNFIKTGTPVPKGSPLPRWPAVGGNQSPYMSLGNKLELRSHLIPKRVELWDDIYSKYYRTPLPPLNPSQAPQHSEL